MDALLAFLATGIAGVGPAAIIVYTLVATHITIIAVTVYLHRAQAHRALQLHPLPSHFFRFWLWLTTGMVTREWVAIHRRHHAHCETAGDPHSPVVKGIRTVLWRGAELYREAAAERAEIDRYGFGTPDDWIERHLYSRFSWQGVGVLLVLDVALFGAIGATVWAVQMLWIPLLAAGVVNGVGHWRGYRNFDCREAATNIFPLGLLIGGEELHNNHHTYARSAKMSVKWYEFDAGWMYIRLLRALRLATVRALPRMPQARRGHTEVDMQTLLAVLGNRASVMAAMAASLRSEWGRELARLRAPGWRSARNLLRRDPDNLSSEHQLQLNALLAQSELLKHIHELRAELAQVWRRSHATPEQLLESLRAWCARAEASASASMRGFARTLRAYA